MLAAISGAVASFPFVKTEVQGGSVSEIITCCCWLIIHGGVVLRKTVVSIECD